MKISFLIRSILYGETIENKMLTAKLLEFDQLGFKLPDYPARERSIAFSKKQLRFPRGNFHEKKRAAMALHSFANHELLAIEMMAGALLILPQNTEEDKRIKIGIFHSLKDEQKHFKLYTNRLNELGYKFGDFPVNEFFWRFMSKIKDAESYFSVMSMTFEAANLDFAKYFEEEFRKIGDVKTADILLEVYRDEISHVALGVSYLNKWRENENLWDYYLSHLPFPLTPARAKGQIFNHESRIQSKMDEEFIKKIRDYRDDYKVTQRKQWKA